MFFYSYNIQIIYQISILFNNKSTLFNNKNKQIIAINIYIKTNKIFLVLLNNICYYREYLKNKTKEKKKE